MMQPKVLGSLSPNKIPVACRPDYTISYERGCECLFVHVDVLRWSHRVCRQFQQDTQALQDLLGEPVYALEELGKPLQLKFLRQSGFIPCGTVTEARTASPIGVYCRPYVGKPILLFNV